MDQTGWTTFQKAAFGITLLYFSLSIIFYVNKVQDLMLSTVLTITSPYRVKPLPMCTNAILRKFFEAHHHFAPGVWSETDPSDMRTSICDFTMPDIQQCLASHGIRKIAILGDSQSRKLYYALTNITANYSQQCVQRENIKMDVGKDLTVTLQNISYPILPKDINCTYIRPDKGNSSVMLEYFLTYQLFEDHYYLFSNVTRQIMAKSLPEILFKYYWHLEYFPDIIILGITFNHDKGLFIDNKPENISYNELSIRIQKLLQIVNLHKLKSTQIFWVPAPAEHESMRKKEIWVNKTFGGILATPRIKAMNEAMYSILEPHILDKGSGHYSFMDTMEATKDKVEWSIDGVHYIDTFYNILAKNILALFCV